MDPRRQRIRNRHAALDIDARPDDMLMNPALFLVLDDKTRLAGEAEISFERIDRLAPLRRREHLVGAGIDVRLVEIVFALGAGWREPPSPGTPSRIVVALRSRYSITVHPFVGLGVARDAWPTSRRRSGCRR